MTIETRRQTLEEPFGVTPERMFEVLTTPSAVRSWWGATSVVIDARKGGSFVAATSDGESKAEFINSFEILEYEPPSRLILGGGKYYAGANWPIRTDITTEFLIEPQPSGCYLQIVIELAPADPLLDDFFDACVAGWQNSFQGIRNHIARNPAK
ncbi:MAG: hypothetical protein DMF63_16170 [Acidobacteria bacterium]|nr:MAG: hypothetical protein DMF63_16170 [Acidobacteriota bacterium]